MYCFDVQARESFSPACAIISWCWGVCGYCWDVMGVVRICCKELSDCQFVMSGEAMVKEDPLGEWKLLKLSHRNNLVSTLPRTGFTKHVEIWWCESNEEIYQVHVLSNYCCSWMYSNFIQPELHNSAINITCSNSCFNPRCCHFLGEQVNQSSLVYFISKKLSCWTVLLVLSLKRTSSSLLLCTFSAVDIAVTIKNHRNVSFSRRQRW